MLTGRTLSDGRMLCDDRGRLPGRGAGVGDGVARCVEGRGTWVEDEVACCLEDGLVYPLRMLTGRTFSNGRMLCDDGDRSPERGAGVSDGVARCLESGLVYPLRMLKGRIFSDG